MTSRARVGTMPAGTRSAQQQAGVPPKAWAGEIFFFSSRRRHTRLTCGWSSDVCSSDLILALIITDTVTKASFGISFPVDIPSLIGGDGAYVGFTGGTESVTGTQDIVNWTYSAIAVAQIGRASCRERV